MENNNQKQYELLSFLFNSLSTVKKKIMYHSLNPAYDKISDGLPIHPRELEEEIIKINL